MRINFDSNSAEETIKIAEKIGRQLRGGEVIELISDLGGGKTTFVNGLVSGAGSNSNVSSPTFSISNIYSCKNFDIAHFDLYRLTKAGLIKYEIGEMASDSKVVLIMEWPDIVEHILPGKRAKINFIIRGEQARTIVINLPNSYMYLAQ